MPVDMIYIRCHNIGSWAEEVGSEGECCQILSALIRTTLMFTMISLPQKIVKGGGVIVNLGAELWFQQYEQLGETLT